MAGRTPMKIVVIRSPKFLRPLLRRIFKLPRRVAG